MKRSHARADAHTLAAETRMYLRIALHVVLVAAALAAPGAVTAQPGSTPPKPKAAESTPGNLWFRIETGGRHIGFYHVVVERVVENQVPLLRLLAESSVSDTTQGYNASHRVDADLWPDDLSILTYSYRAEESGPAGRVELQLTCRKTGEQQWVAFHRGPSGAVDIPISSDTPLTAEEAVALFVAKAKGSKPGPLPLRVVNPFQADLIYVDIDVEVRPGDKVKIGDKDVPVTPYKWRRALPAPVKELDVTEYLDEKSELLMSKRTFTGTSRGVDFVRAADEVSALPAGKRLVKRRGRRDPFDKAKALTPKGVEKGRAPEEPQKPGPTTATPSPEPPKPATSDPAVLARHLNGARQVVQRAEEVFRTEPKDTAEPKISKLFDTFLDHTAGVVGSTVATEENKNEVRQLRDRFEKVYQAALTLITQGRKLKEAANDAFDEGRYADVRKLVEEVRGLGDRPEIRGSPQYGPLFEQQVAAPARKLEDRIKVREEFQKIKLEITGIIYNMEETPFPVDLGVRVLGQELKLGGTVRLPVSRSGAIVNGFPVEEGDLLDKQGKPGQDLKPEDALTVLRIREDDVIFRFRGEDVSVALR